MFICCFCCFYNRQLAWLGSDYNFLFVLLDCQSLCGAQICLVCVPHSGHSRTCTVIYLSSLILKAFDMLVRSDSYICNSEVHIQLYGITLPSFLLFPWHFAKSQGLLSSSYSFIYERWKNIYIKDVTDMIPAFLEITVKNHHTVTNGIFFLFTLAPFKFSPVGWVFEGKVEIVKLAFQDE